MTKPFILIYSDANEEVNPIFNTFLGTWINAWRTVSLLLLSGVSKLFWRGASEFFCERAAFFLRFLWKGFFLWRGFFSVNFWRRTSLLTHTTTTTTDFIGEFAGFRFHNGDEVCLGDRTSESKSLFDRKVCKLFSFGLPLSSFSKFFQQVLSLSSLAKRVKRSRTCRQLARRSLDQHPLAEHLDSVLFTC